MDIEAHGKALWETIRMEVVEDEEMERRCIQAVREAYQAGFNAAREDERMWLANALV